MRYVSRMFNISRLKIRNFKSFKAADVKITDNFVCFAGPNGSGKSNIMDAIRFGMGETSLRSLRAKRVKDLIHAGAKTAEVLLVFTNGQEQTEIRRAIRQDGKIQYRLNGKRTTRGAILEALKKQNLDSSGRNTIAQGEVQRLINMNGKERRLIIDNVAGIADFEEKKKEAMRELDTVDTRIKDAQLVLGERRAFLKELGREKEVALKYMDSRKTLTNAKGTLLKTEIGRHEKDLSSLLEKEDRLKTQMTEHEKALEAINKQIDEIEAKRHGTSQELQSKQKTNALIRRLEELKASSGSRKQLIEDKQVSIEKSMKERKDIGKRLASEREAIAALEKGSEGLLKDLGEAESKLNAHGGTAEDKATAALRKKLYEHERSLTETKERLITLSSDIESKREILQTKREEWGSIAAGDSDDDDSSGNPDALRAEVKRMMSEIDASFQKTKEINREIER
jgi:chromosome segregation protein